MSARYVDMRQGIIVSLPSNFSDYDVRQGLCAAGGTSRTTGCFWPWLHLSAHPVCAAVALRAQQLLQERDVIGHVRSVAPTFAAHVASMDQYDFIGHVRSIGLIGAMEFTADKNTHQKFDASHKIAAQAVAIIQNHGVILRALPGDIIGFCPPLIISKVELDDMFKRVHDAMLGVTELAAKLR